MRPLSWIVRRALTVGLAFSAAIGLAAFAFSGVRDVLLDAYLLGIGGVLLLALARTTNESGPATGTSDFDRAFSAMSRRYASDSGELALVHDVQQSVASTFHLHTRLRPILQEIAAHRLSMRFGVDLDTEPERARELIGVEAWELVRPGRPPPSDRLAPGPPAAQLSKVVDELKRI
jgi:hypothetical protein